MLSARQVQIATNLMALGIPVTSQTARCWGGFKWAEDRIISLLMMAMSPILEQFLRTTMGSSEEFSETLESAFGGGASMVLPACKNQGKSYHAQPYT